MWNFRTIPPLGGSEENNWPETLPAERPAGLREERELVA
jgi:hypothetical protein